MQNIENHVKDDLYNDRSQRTFGYGVLVLLVLVVTLWGGLAPIESAVFAPGVVQVDGKRKAVQHLEGGIISQILVANGDKVEQQQPLIVLDIAQATAARDIYQGRLYNIIAQRDRLVAERDDVMLRFSDSLAQAAETDVRAMNAISSERALYLARANDRKGEENVLVSQRKGVEAVLESRRIVAESLRQETHDLQDLLEEGYVDKQRLRELERSRSQVLGDVADLEVSIEEIDLRITQLAVRFKTQVVDELAETTEALYDIEQRHAASDDSVQRGTIRAPVSGTVLNLVPNTIGAVIQPGETIVEIVPQASELMIDVRIAPQDIDRVAIGHEAEIRFSVFKDAYLVSGVLTKLSPDRLIDHGTDFPYYSAEITFGEEDLFLLEGWTLIPGMPAEVLVKTGERTMLDYLTSPMNRMFSRALIED